MGWNARFYYCGIVCLLWFCLREQISQLFLPDCLLPWHKRSLVALKLLNGSWIQSWWCARNQAMLIYLLVTSLTLEGSSVHYFLLYAWYYLAITQSFRLFCCRLNANFTEDGHRGNVWHTWWTFLRGRLDNVNGMSQEGYFINRWKLFDCDLFICLFHWHTHLKDMNSLWGSICYGRDKQLLGLLTSYHVNIWTWWNRYMPRLVKLF